MISNGTHSGAKIKTVSGSPEFQKSCQAAEIPASKRQWTKWLAERGVARRMFNELKKG